MQYVKVRDNLVQYMDPVESGEGLLQRGVTADPTPPLQREQEQPKGGEAGADQLPAVPEAYLRQADADNRWVDLLGSRPGTRPTRCPWTRSISGC